jgi:hypothetical protein
METQSAKQHVAETLTPGFGFYSYVPFMFELTGKVPGFTFCLLVINQVIRSLSDLTSGTTETVPGDDPY